MNTRAALALILLSCFFWLPVANVSARPRRQEQPGLVIIYSPVPGEALQGMVSIDVGIEIPGLSVASLEFRYTNHPTDTWFLLAQTSESKVDGIMAQWDTTTITDGIYDLRLSAVTQDQQMVEFVVAGLRIRNYSPIETETPAPVVPTETLYPGQATRTPLPSTTPLPPTVTPLPTNPAILTAGQFTNSLVAGSVAVLILFVALGAYSAGRAFWRQQGMPK